MQLAQIPKPAQSQTAPSAVATPAFDREFELAGKNPSQTLRELGEVSKRLNNDQLSQKIIDRAVLLLARDNPKQMAQALSEIAPEYRSKVQSSLSKLAFLWEDAVHYKDSSIGVAALIENARIAPTAAAKHLSTIADSAWVVPLVSKLAEENLSLILADSKILANQPWFRSFVEGHAAKNDPRVIDASRALGDVDQNWARGLLEGILERRPTMIAGHFQELSVLGNDWAVTQLAKHRKHLGDSPLNHPPELKAVPEPLVSELFAEAARRNPANVHYSYFRSLPARALTAAMREAILQVPSSRNLVPQTYEGSRHNEGFNAVLDSLISQATDVAERRYFETYAALIKSRPRGFGDIISGGESTLLHRVLDFTGVISEGRMTVDQVKKLVRSETEYLSALIGEIDRGQTFGADGIRRAIDIEALPLLRTFHQRNTIADPAIRFKEIKNFTASETAHLLCTGIAEAQTSTYRGMYAALEAKMTRENKSSEDIADRLSEKELLKFFVLASRFSTLSSFLSRFKDDDRRDATLERLVSAALRSSPSSSASKYEPIEDFSEIMTSASDSAATNKLARGLIRISQGGAENEVLAGLTAAAISRTKTVNIPEFQLIAAKYAKELKDTPRLEYKTLLNDQGAIVQFHHFYSDDDGRQSYLSFYQTYARSAQWRIEDKGSFVIIHSNSTKPAVEIFANKPIVKKPEQREEPGIADIKKFLEEKKISPSVIVHRGHADYVYKTLESISASTKFVYLGGCGGFGEISDTLDRAPDAQFISTRVTGTLVVNDPLLFAINSTLASGQNIEWKPFWDVMTQRFKGEPRFDEYVPPHRNTLPMIVSAFRRLTGSGRQELE